MEETLIVDLYYKGKPYEPRAKIPLLFREKRNSLRGELINEFFYEALRDLYLYKSVRSQTRGVITSWYIGDNKPVGRIPWEKLNENSAPLKNGILLADDLPALKKKYIAIDMSPPPLGLGVQVFGVDGDGNNVVQDTLNVAWFYNGELISPLVSVPLVFKNPGTATCTATSEYVANICDSVGTLWRLNDKYCANKEYRAQWYTTESEPTTPIRWCTVNFQPEDKERTITLGELCAQREGYTALNITSVENVVEGTPPNISLFIDGKAVMKVVSEPLLFTNKTGRECPDIGEYTTDLTEILIRNNWIAEGYTGMPYIRWYIADKETATPIQWCPIKPEITKILAFKDLPSYQNKYIAVDITADEYGSGGLETRETLVVDLFYKQEPFKLRYTLPLVFKNLTGSPCASSEEYTACLRDAVLDFWKFEYPQEAVRQSLFVRWHMKDTKQPCPIKWRNIMPGRGCAYGEETILLKDLPALKKQYIAVDVSAQPYEVSLQCMMCPKKALLANVSLGETFCSVACYERK